MELTFYDINGNPIAYTTDEGDVFSFSGIPLAYIDNDSVYSYNGNHLGWFINNWIIDHDGYYLFFSEYSIGGPFKPFRRFKPFKSLRQLKPLKYYKKLKPYKKYLKLSWSNLSAEEFFELKNRLV